ncbi:MAG TPA: UvrD-helicase domain-containing protein [Opitutaceae bacterium]
MKTIGHRMILASAGSGKTYALTNRFVQLLASGAAPERVVALTFTRKAAGEFFDEILRKLAQAATDPGFARRLAHDVGAPAFGTADFLRLLRAVIDAMPRLSLGTLDGFFARIVRSFPLELGLSGDFEVMDESVARRERRRVLRRLFSAAGEPEPAQREFIEAFKRATFGSEEKQLARVLDGFLDDYAETYLAAPEAAQWGEAARIWPQGCAWLAEAERRETAAKELRAVWPWAGLNEKQRGRLEAFFAALPEWLPGAPVPDAVAYLVKNAFLVWPDLRRGRAELTLERKKVPLEAGACAALVAVVAGIAGAEFARRLEMTRGLFAVLRGYERQYHDAVRRVGRLTFADVQRLLLPEAGAPVLSGDAGGDARLLVDWRLDASFDHWLLDEFQDTSFGQWSILRNLIDEAVQDAERRRSFFYVGDVKQAIFSWREGDPRLFREIFDHYNRAAPGTIEEGRLDQSWRSGPAVVAMVNRVFANAAALHEIVPASVADTWIREWRDHESARPWLGGYAGLRHAPDEAGRFAETLRILREIEPLRRGLEVAVLVRKNDTAAALADYLRRVGGLAAVAESDVRVAADNPLTCALLALLRAAAHPGDTLAQEHVRMTPLGALLAAEGLSTRDALTTRVLAEVHETGFAGTLERWLRKLEMKIADEAFSAGRGRLLVEAAELFDETGSRDVAEFLEFAARHTVRDTDTAGVVRVMTIHKSKGLGFDLVLLPDLEGKTIAERRDGLAVEKGADRSVQWVLELPPKMFYERDPVLAAHVASAEGDAAYEALCLLYVAMTRAKRAMYVITEPAGQSSSRNFPKLLEAALGGTWADGDPAWWQGLPLVEKPEAPAEALAPLAGGEATRGARLLSLTPSGAAHATVRGEALFALSAGRAAAFGIAVHELLATVEWAYPETNDAWLANAAGVSAEAVAQAQMCLTAPALADVWARPAGAVLPEVWRERAFEVVLDGAWVTGIFDRVVIVRDPGGRATRATVYDFKTDAVRDAGDAAEAAKRYGEQLRIYRRVAARLVGLPAAAVGVELVFTAIPLRLPVA